MTATTTTPTTTTAGTGGVSTAGILRSEWLKLVTVRSTWWTTIIALLIAAAIDALFGGTVNVETGSGTGSLAVLGSTISLTFDALVVGVLGVLAIGGEYTTLQIRSSYTAVPKRWPALVAKALVVGAWSFVLGLVVTFGGFGIIAALFAGKGVDVPFDGATVGALIGGASYLAIVAMFAVGLGAVVRASAAGITILTAVLFVAPIILNLASVIIRADWIAHAANFLLSAAGGVLFAAPGSAAIELWAALIALAAWLAVVWIPAILLTVFRDV